MTTSQIFRPHRLQLRQLPRPLRHPQCQAQQPSRASWTSCRPPQLLLRPPLIDLRNQRRRHRRLARSTRCSRPHRKRAPARLQFQHPRIPRRLRWAPRVQPWHHLWALAPLPCLVNLPSRLGEGLTICGRCPSALPPRASPLHRLAPARAYATWRRRRHRQGYGVHRTRRDLQRRVGLDHS